METAAYLCDVIGPRLTNSPAARRANQWSRERFESWGLSERPPRELRAGRARLELRPRRGPPRVPADGAPPRHPQGLDPRDERSGARQGRQDQAPHRRGPDGGEGEARGEDRPPRRRPRGQGRGQAGPSPATPRRSWPTSGSSRCRRQRKIEEERAAEKKRRGFRGKLNQFLSDEKALAAIEPSREEGVVRVEGGQSMKPEDPKGVPEPRDAGRALQPPRPPPRSRPRRGAGGRRPGPLPRRRPHGLQHRGRDPRHRQEGRAGHGGRPHGLVARGHRSHGQRSRRRRRDGGGPHPEGSRRQAAADDPLRPLDRRGGVEALGIGVVRQAALRRARSFGGPGGQGPRPGPPAQAGQGHAEARPRAAAPRTSTSTTARARSAGSTPRRTPPSPRSSRHGSGPSPTWGRPP